MSAAVYVYSRDREKIMKISVTPGSLTGMDPELK